MAEALKAVNAKTDLYSQTRTQITGAIGGLLEAGVVAGTLRADVEPEDVLRAMGCIWMIDGPGVPRAGRAAPRARDGRPARRLALVLAPVLASSRRSSSALSRCSWRSQRLGARPRSSTRTSR